MFIVNAFDGGEAPLSFPVSCGKFIWTFFISSQLTPQSPVWSGGKDCPAPGTEELLWLQICMCLVIFLTWFIAASWMFYAALSVDIVYATFKVNIWNEVNWSTFSEYICYSPLNWIVQNVLRSPCYYWIVSQGTCTVAIMHLLKMLSENRNNKLGSCPQWPSGLGQSFIISQVSACLCVCMSVIFLLPWNTPLYFSQK